MTFEYVQFLSPHIFPKASLSSLKDMCLKSCYDLCTVTAMKKNRETVETEWIKQGGLCQIKWGCQNRNYNK